MSEEISQVRLKAQTALCIQPGSSILCINRSPQVFSSSAKELTAGVSSQTNQISKYKCADPTVTLGSLRVGSFVFRNLSVSVVTLAFCAARGE